MEEQSRRPLWRALTRAGLVAALAFLALVPYLYYITRVGFAGRLRRGIPVERLLQADLPLVALLLVLCALAGSLLGRRYGLPGLGTLAGLRPAWPWLVSGGLALSAATYLLFGRHLAELVPGIYPASLGWALVVPLKAALFDETVARYGMMTVLAGATRSPMSANLLQAMIFTLMPALQLSFYGLDWQWTVFFMGSLLVSFATNLLLGLAYARQGLAASSLLHLVLDLKYVAHAIVG